jgi:FkbM family methyltransferase
VNTIKTLKSLIKRAANSVGLDILRMHNSPEQTLCGLKKLPIRTVIDVGANTGQFARKISTFFPKAMLYCFEPLPTPYEQLQCWSQSRKGKVKSFDIAIGEEEGQIDIIAHIDHTPSSSLLSSTDTCTELYPFTNAQKKIPVKISTLDRQFDGIIMEPDILVKVDVQGYEDRVIRGGGETFKKAKACVLEVGMDKLYKNQAKFENILFLLADLGYQYKGNLNQTYGKDGHVIYLDAVFQK